MKTPFGWREFVIEGLVVTLSAILTGYHGTRLGVPLEAQLLTSLVVVGVVLVGREEVAAWWHA